MSRLVNTLSLKQAADIANRSTRQTLSAANAFGQASTPEAGHKRPVQERKLAL